MKTQSVEEERLPKPFRESDFFAGVPMEGARFEFKSFKPRTGVSAELNRLLYLFVRDDAPRGARPRAMILATSTAFHLSIVVRVGDAAFNSEAQINKRQLVGAPRDWQVTEVTRILQDLRSQLKVWSKSRAISAAPLRPRSPK